RIPYYVAVPLAAAVTVAALAQAPRGILAAGLAALTVAMLVGGGLAVYHAGIEWKWWVGPRDCSGPLGSLGDAKELMDTLRTINPVRCDEAPFRIAGLSLAGWNALIALALAAVAVWGIAATAGARKRARE